MTTGSARPNHAGRRSDASALRSLKRFLRDGVIAVQLFVFRRIYGMDIGPGCRISLKARMDKTNPRGVHVGEGSYIAFGAVVLAHDMSRVVHLDTYIGRNCFIGAHAIILPGVSVGDECLVGSGAVVTKDVPAHSVVVGNPARVVRRGVSMRSGGILAEAYDDALRSALTGAP